jgi:transposase-like protein
MASHRDGSVRRRLTPQQRQQLLAHYHRSKLTQREFAARHNLGVSTLGRWLQQERPEGQPAVDFQEVVMGSATGRWAMELVTPQGWTIRLAGLGEVESLPQLLNALPC